MPTTIRPSGITVDTHGPTTVRPAPALRRRRGPLSTGAPPSGGRRRGAPSTRAPLTEQEAIVDALEEQQLDLVDAIPLVAATPEAARKPSRRRGPAATTPEPVDRVDLTVPLGPDESAVVLVERDGVYEWQLAGEGALPSTPPEAPRRRRRGAPDAARAARFTIDVTPPAALPPPSGRPRKRRGGLVTTLVVGQVVAYVFKFTARPILGGATRFLERNVREGLVHIPQVDPDTWTTLSDEAPLPLPSGRPARVLLFVHGTFSSTLGSFGALAGQPDGRAFLARALRDYDIVIGWDHRTLSVQPTDNAVDLATRLERLGFEQPPHVDAIAFSRGGLVLRSLIEHVLPSSPHALVVRRAVFVACANGGTELARPENWHRFVDRYTNLAAAGARAAAMVPEFASAAAILASSIRGVGTFVKVMATASMTGDAVPGIAAMNPDGDFVREINGAQPGQPSPDDTYYCAITSNFDPDAARQRVDPGVMSPTLLLKLSDKAVDSLYGKPNDLVVHVDAMTQFDETTGTYVKDRLDFGTNAAVHHCGYFSQPRTATRLASWLEVSTAAETDGGLEGMTAARRSPASATRRARAGQQPAQGDVVRLRCTMPVAAAIERLEGSTAQWVVVERPLVEDHRPVTYWYAHPTPLCRDWLRGWAGQPGATVFDAFGLRESHRSNVARFGDAAPVVRLDPGQSPGILQYHGGSRYRTVIVDRGQPVGVLAPAEDRAMADSAAPAQADGGEMLESLAQPRRRRFRGAAARPAAPRAAAPAAAPPAAAPTAAPSAGTATCHFQAETDSQYVDQRVHTVAVTISRDALVVTAGKETARGSAKVKTAKPLVVECMPMLRVAMVDPDDARVQVPVPDKGTPTELRFDVVAKEVGAAEIRVQVRQGPVPLVTMTLKPTVVAAGTTAASKVKAEASLEDLPSTLPKATDELRIIQMRPTGNQTQYRYELRLPSKRVQKQFESSLLDSDPATYVEALHTRIEDRWAQYRSEKDAFARDLRAIGSEMFDALFPLELRQLLWQHRETIGSVQVLSSEPFIPWELVLLRDPATRKAGPDAAFLGELGVVRWLVTNYPPERLRLRAGTARYVVPEYPPPDALPAAEEEIAMVAERFGATAVPAEAEAVYRLVERPGQFDLLHIACHGLADAADIDSARLEMPGKPRSDGSMSEEHVLATTVAHEAELIDGEHQPIVVLNACQSARGGYSLKGIGGFAQAFIEGGAGVFIGSSWSVGDEPALSFIDEFYARFLDDTKPEPLARASAAARKKARDDGDATWLAYVVYGHPRAVVRREP